MLYKGLFLTTVLMWGPGGRAYESLPEFRSLTQEEATTFDDPKRIDSEHSSHLLNYQYPLDWDRTFWLAPKALDLAFGSLTSKEFFVDQRLKFHQPLTDRMEFRFIWFEDRDLEDDQSQRVIELIYWTRSHWGFSLFGSPSLYKDEDDLGFAWIAATPGESESRVYADFPDFQRNFRNQESDRWVDAKAPYVLGGVHRFDRSSRGIRNAGEFSLRWESPTHWDFPAEGRLYIYSRQAAQGTYIRQTDPDHKLYLRAFADDKREGQSPTVPAGTATPEERRRRRIFFQVERGHYWGPYEIRYGVHYYYRQFQNLNKQLINKDALPTLWVFLPESTFETWAYQWQLGYDLTLHNAIDDSGLLAESPKSFKTENRFNVVSQFRFGRSSFLQLAFTFDFDRLGSGETWEGGAGRFRADF